MRPVINAITFPVRLLLAILVMAAAIISGYSVERFVLTSIWVRNNLLTISIVFYLLILLLIKL